jgi:hypothetical protein
MPTLSSHDDDPPTASDIPSPTSDGESDVIPAGRDDDSASDNKARLPGGSADDAISENSLDSKPRTTEPTTSTTSSGNSVEPIPHTNITDVDSSNTEPSTAGAGRDGGGRDEGNTPLSTAASSGMVREEVEGEQYQTPSGIDGRQLSEPLPAGSASGGGSLAGSGTDASPTQRDHIPANNGGAMINGTVDLDPLGHPPAHLSGNESLTRENAASDQEPVNSPGALENEGYDTLEPSSEQGAAGADFAGGGSKVDGLGSNSTAGSVPGPNGAGAGVNGSEGGGIQNQTEAQPGRNGNQTGSGAVPNGVPTQQKEKSVFLRLSNHIDNLEANMTLFSIFLDQISTRYKGGRENGEGGEKGRVEVRDRDGNEGRGETAGREEG